MLRAGGPRVGEGLPSLPTFCQTWGFPRSAKEYTPFSKDIPFSQGLLPFVWLLCDVSYVYSGTLYVFSV